MLSINLQSKSDLIRELIKSRVSQTSEINLNESTIDSLEGMMLAGMPESTIVMIVENYVSL